MPRPPLRRPHRSSSHDSHWVPSARTLERLHGEYLVRPPLNLAVRCTCSACLSVCTASVRKASEAVASIGAERGGVPEELMSELYCRNSWGLFWPTLFALKRIPGKSVYYLGYKDSQGRQHIIPSVEIRAVTVKDATLELTIFTDITTVGNLTLRMGSRVEFVRWVAAMHDKWVEVAEVAQGK